ncbi:MAG TPA: response regulator [Bacteroidia bacterium]|jgi:DNA-binding NarL/FixJ family response regulator
MSNDNQINIFIVEDNTVFRLALKGDIETAFPNKQIKVHAFETGEICMLEFKKIKPQVVILDYNLDSKHPDAVDGIKVLDWIKKEEKKTAVIMLTAQDSIEIALKSFKHGASDYVVKTETKFRKINNALFNLFKTMEAKREASFYKRLTLVFGACIVVLVAAVFTIQIFAPTILK